MASPLIFTTPIPSYHAPEDVTISAAARAFVPLTNVIQDIPSAEICGRKYYPDDDW